MSKIFNRQRFRVIVIASLFFGCGLSSAKDSALVVQGVVVAIQRSKTDTRTKEPESFADMAEIYMVRADHWSASVHTEKYILIDYVHHAGLIAYEQFDRTHWAFELHPQSPETNKECLSWMARGAKEELTFMPTAFGSEAQPPDARTLSCFLVTERPSPLP
jgi:hypothetical protein